MSARPALMKLPLGAQVKLPGESDEDLVRRVNADMEKVSFSFDETRSLMLMRRVTVIATLDSWTRPEPLPTIDTIGDLPRDVVAALDVAIGGMAIEAGVEFEATSDKASPTTPSSDSSGPSEGVSTPTTPSTPTPPEDSAPTSTESSTPA